MRLLAFTVTALITFSLAALAASGAEVTREEYVARVEPICKANADANSRILKGVRTKVKKEQLDAAAAQFSKAATALRKTLRQLRAVPQPADDAARLGRWLGYIAEEADLLQSTATKLRKGDKFGAQKMAVRLTQTVNRANNAVLGFEFRHCTAEPSQFT